MKAFEICHPKSATDWNVSFHSRQRIYAQHMWLRKLNPDFSYCKFKFYLFFCCPFLTLPDGMVCCLHNVVMHFVFPRIWFFSFFLYHAVFLSLFIIGTYMTSGLLSKFKSRFCTRIVVHSSTYANIWQNFAVVVTAAACNIV